MLCVCRAFRSLGPEEARILQSHYAEARSFGKKNPPSLGNVLLAEYTITVHQVWRVDSPTMRALREDDRLYVLESGPVLLWAFERSFTRWSLESGRFPSQTLTVGFAVHQSGRAEHPDDASPLQLPVCFRWWGKEIGIVAADGSRFSDPAATLPIYRLWALEEALRRGSNA